MEDGYSHVPRESVSMTQQLAICGWCVPYIDLDGSTFSKIHHYCMLGIRKAAFGDNTGTHYITTQ